MIISITEDLIKKNRKEHQRQIWLYTWLSILKRKMDENNSKKEGEIIL